MIRAFKSTLEDMEEKRSEHSVHSFRSSRSHSGLRPLSDNVTYIDDDALKSAGGASSLHPNPGERNRGGGGGGSALLAGGGGAAAGEHERHRHRHSAEHAANNNNRTGAERKSLSAGSGTSAVHVTVNGHHVAQSAGANRGEYLPSMSPPQLLTGPYQTTAAPTGAHYQLPSQLPPSGLLPVRYDVLDYDSLPDLPADLPRLVHETSI